MNAVRISAVPILLVMFAMGQPWESEPAWADEGPATSQPSADPVPLPTSTDALLTLSRECAAWGGVRESQRTRIAVELTARLQTDATWTRSVGLSRWKEFARLLGEDMTAEQRDVWSQRIRQAFAPDDTALFALSAGQLMDVVGIFDSLGYATAAADTAWRWLKNYQSSGQSPAANLAGVAVSGLGSKLDAAADKLKLLEDLERRWLTENAEHPMGANECGAISRLWRLCGRGAKAREWVMRGYENGLGNEQARSSADSSRLTVIGQLLVEYGKTGRGKAYPAFAQVAARLIREGKLQTRGVWIQFYSEPLGTPETRQTVRAELVDPQGQPRLAAAKVLTWAYHYAAKDEFNAYMDFLNQKLAAAQNGTDAKALWLLAKAYAEPYVPPRPHRPRGKRWLDLALATAVSENVRLLAVQELGDYFKDIDSPLAAVGFLDSIQGQFQGQATASILSMRQDLKMQIATAKAVSDRRHAIDDRLRKMALLKYYQHCLASARVHDNAEQVAKLQTAIAQVQAELSQ